MKYFTPKLAKGQLAALPLQLSAYKYNFLWPLEEEAPRFQHIFHYFTACVSLLAFLGTLIAEFKFIIENFSDIPAMTECLTTTCMGLQYSIRIILWIRRQQEVRLLFRRFYREIYFADFDDAKFKREIHSRMRVPDFFTKVYYTPMALIYMKFCWDIFNIKKMSAPNKPYIYRMSFMYDAQQPVAYIITAIYTGWLTFSCVSLMSSEDFSMCLMLCHMSYRVKELQQSLQRLYEEAPKCNNNNSTTQRIFRKKLHLIFRRQQKLYSFIAAAKNYFTYQVFFTMGFGVAVLCVVAFQFQKTPIGSDWVKYIIWLISQISQFLMIGYFGQMLSDATSDMQHSYYMCNWEQIMSYGDVHSNKLLMYDLRFAMMNAQNPVVFDGLNFVSLTHGTVGTALRSALSYFMFLNTMNDGNKTK